MALVFGHLFVKNQNKKQSEAFLHKTETLRFLFIDIKRINEERTDPTSGF